uniref:JmjC domain-containing protein n=1 Tax=Glossina brevipalpis TaxID=37001 RepID=A0A1A9W7P4_9MUSC
MCNRISNNIFVLIRQHYSVKALCSANAMENLEELFNLLPKYLEIKDILLKNSEANYIISLALEILKNFIQNVNKTIEEWEESSYLIQALIDKSWETIHTDHFGKVPLYVRQIYSIACYLKIFFLLLENSELQQIEKCSKILDEGLLIGYPQKLYERSDKFVDQLMQIFNEKLNSVEDLKLPIIENKPRLNVSCDIPQLERPSVEIFKLQYFEREQPALLLNTLTEWPALKLWPDLNYILKLAGNRIVPIEIGSNYANEEWSQQLMKLRDFLKRQFSSSTDNSSQKVEYLAQHELFEQIPLLKKDFNIPDYCSLRSSNREVDIKAWLGPKGTVSPLHYDPKHNLLCQVFGSKRIILASPDDSKYLYAHESEFLRNTSQIEVGDIDYQKFPLVAKVKFYYLTLQAGDCLYIPPKWWHYVKSQSPSFSVSFWWK